MAPFKIFISAALGFVALQCLLSCQVAFGDFKLDTTKLAVSCQSNVTRCNGRQIETCVNGNDWKVLEVCSSPDLCDLNTLSCRPCQPGSFQCDEAQPEGCGVDNKWTARTPAPCASAALCVVPDDGSAAFCAAPGCPFAGQLQCLGDHLQRCPASQTAWQDVEICASAALCDVVRASAEVAAGKFATCRVPTCRAGQFNCDTGSPRSCSPDQTGWAEAPLVCPSGSVCHPGKGDCSACAVGAEVCSGHALLRCTEQLAWAATECSSALSCATGPAPGCDPPTCAPGAFQCRESALERCRSDGGKWEPIEQCINNALCNPAAVRCEIPRCPVAGAKRCKGNQHQQCRDNLTGWDELSTCSDPADSCDPEKGCVTTPCLDGAYRCNDVALERCTNKVWARQALCATVQLCDADHQVCTPPACAAGERQCLGAVLRRCNAALSGWDEIATCVGTQVCNPDTKRCEQR